MIFPSYRARIFSIVARYLLKAATGVELRFVKIRIWWKKISYNIHFKGIKFLVICEPLSRWDCQWAYQSNWACHSKRENIRSVIFLTTEKMQWIKCKEFFRDSLTVQRVLYQTNWEDPWDPSFQFSPLWEFCRSRWVWNVSRPILTALCKFKKNVNLLVEKF